MVTRCHHFTEIITSLYYQIKKYIIALSKGGNMKFPIIFFLLVIIIITAGCVGDPQGRTRYCGFIKYDIYEGFCCGSTFYASQERSSVGCCNGVSYNLDSQFCCDGVIYSSRTTQHCCNGKVASGGGSWQDCGSSQCYRSDTQSCCRGVVYNTTDQDCCGAVVYDKTNQACCNEKTVYNPTNQHCCNGKVASGGGYWFDCSGQCFQADRQSCCYEGTYNSPLNGTIHEGTDSCCIGRLHSINGLYCYPGNGLYYPPQTTDWNICRSFVNGHWSC
jgi:hypothetical protein